MTTIIKSFEAKELKKRSWAIRMADTLATFFGSIQFLFLTFFLFGLWVIINMGLIPGIPIFDPYPFILLITAVSLEAIILTVVVLMSQNRQNYVNSLREEMDFQINLIAEKEISKTLKLLIRIAEKQGIKITDKELKEIVEDVKVSYLERQLASQMEQKGDSFVKTLTRPFNNKK